MSFILACLRHFVNEGNIFWSTNASRHSSFYNFEWILNQKKIIDWSWYNLFLPFLDSSAINLAIFSTSSIVMLSEFKSLHSFWVMTVLTADGFWHSVVRNSLTVSSLFASFSILMSSVLFWESMPQTVRLRSVNSLAKSILWLVLSYNNI